MEIFWCCKLNLSKRTEEGFRGFVNKMSKRIAQGHARYGHPNKDKKYMTRLVLEVNAYKKTGNLEHLINAANYCFLEHLEPENKRFHFDATVDSATRKRVF